jgi:hypothetical protein
MNFNFYIPFNHGPNGAIGLFQKCEKFVNLNFDNIGRGNFQCYNNFFKGGWMFFPAQTLSMNFKTGNGLPHLMNKINLFTFLLSKDKAG